MGARFSVQYLLGGGAFISGTDVNGVYSSTEVSTDVWDSVKEQLTRKSNQKQFDLAVEDFFKPLTSAAEAIAKAEQVVEDELSFVEFEPAKDAVEGTHANRVYLPQDAIILRILEEGSQADINRLVWSRTHTLVVLAESPAAGSVDTEPLF